MVCMLGRDGRVIALRSWTRQYTLTLSVSLHHGE